MEIKSEFDGVPFLARYTAVLGIALLLLQASDCLAGSPVESAASTASGTVATPASVESAPLPVNKRPPDTSDKSLQALVVSPPGDPTLLTFKSLRIGRSSNVQTIVLTAGTAGAAKLTDIRASGGFAVTPTKCELDARDSCALSVTFVPTQTGEAKSAVVVSGPNGTSRVVALLSGEATSWCQGCESVFGFWPVVVLALLYTIALIAFRWNMIALPSRRLLHAEIDALEVRTKALASAWSPPAATITEIQLLLNHARESTPLQPWGSMKSDVFFWSRGQESAGWGLLHQAQVQLVPYLPAEELRADLERSESQLRALGNPVAAGIADRIHTDLSSTVAAIADEPRAVLGQMSAFLNRLEAQQSQIAANIQAAAGLPTPAQMQALSDIIIASMSSQGDLLAAQIARALLNPPAGTPAAFVVLLQTAQSFLTVAPAVAADLVNGLGAAAPVPAAPPLTATYLRARDQFFSLAKSLASELDAALDGARLCLYPLARWRALLSESTQVLVDREDTDISTQLSWHNKTIWLIACGLILILVLAGALENEVLFVLGALGGLLSRLSRTLSRQDVPTDYGASWTTLFLSPVVGALTGWAGVLLVALAVKFGVLGPLFASVAWDSNFNLLAFGLAIVFGFSERAFDSVLSGLENYVVGKGSASSTAANASAALSIDGSNPPSAATANALYRFTFKATGGTAPYTWAIVPPPPLGGFAIDNSGALSGTPPVVPFKITLQVTDHARGSNSKTFTI